MNDVLRECRLFEGLDANHLARVISLAEHQTLSPGEHLFDLGAKADWLFVVLQGQIELCVPITLHGTIQEIAMESQWPGSAIGWSAFVRPYHFRLSARAAGASEVARFERKSIERLIHEDPTFGCRFLERIAEIIGQRLLTVQALWAREFQRTVAAASQHRTENSSVKG